MAVARKVRAEVKEFAIGFGPKLFSRKGKSGTVYSLRLLPLGGYCDIDDDSIRALSAKDQIKIFLAGVTVNFVTGFTAAMIATKDILNGAQLFWLIARETIKLLFQLITFQIPFDSYAGLAETSTELGSMINGYQMLFAIFTIIAVSLGIFNLFPIPVLDGGRVVQITYKEIFKKDMSKKLINALSAVGIAYMGMVYLIGFLKDLVFIFQ